MSAISAGTVSAFPLRWESRRKALLSLPEGANFDYDLDEVGLMKQIRLDMGQVISAQPVKIYPNDSWSETYDNQVPEISSSQVQVEYTAHADALFHLEGGLTVPVSELTGGQASSRLTPISPASQRVKLRVVEKGSRRPVAVKLHLHGASGEYLPPADHHRIPNSSWFEDYGAEYLHQRRHFCAYIPGETVVDLPVGNVYLEVSKGFEMKPLRKVMRVGPDTESLTLEIEKVLNWREKNWVTADTHVHFLSPQTALLEGSAEGVNVVNLLASQWGELITNVGDCDGKTTFGSRQAGGDGEWVGSGSVRKTASMFSDTSHCWVTEAILSRRCVPPGLRKRLWGIRSMLCLWNGPRNAEPREGWSLSLTFQIPAPKTPPIWSMATSTPWK